MAKDQSYLENVLGFSMSSVTGSGVKHLGKIFIRTEHVGQDYN